MSQAKDPDLLKALESVFQAERCSLVCYLRDVSHAVVENDWESRVKALLEEWYAETRSALMRIEALFDGADFSPAPGNWPLEFTQANFLSYARVLEILEQDMPAQVRALRSSLDVLKAWPQARAELSQCIATDERFIESCKQLSRERPAPKKPPEERPYVSANFW